LVFVAWLTREVTFVLNAAFSLRGLTSGALLGALALALFGRGVGPRAAVAGMLASFAGMNLIYWPATMPGTREWWLRTFGGEVFWPWFTLIGFLITVGVAALLRPRAIRPA
jgi:Na+/proline symporter